MVASPSGRAPEQGSRLDRFGTEACGGDKILLKVLAPRVLVFIGNYGGGIRSVGPPRGPHGQGARPTPWARPPSHVGPSWLLSIAPEASQVSCVPEKIIKKFHRVWTFVGIDFL